MKSLVRRFGAWLMRPLPKQQAHLLGTVLTFFLGALGSFTFVLTDADFSVPVMGAFVFTTAFAVSRSDVRRWMRVIAFAMICGAYALWTYESIAFGGELAWTISVPVWLLIFGLVIGVVFTHRPNWKYLEIPPVLPMGVVVVASLLGWKSEEGRVRCEDWRAVTEQPGVRIIVPTVPHTCAGDDRIPVSRFPRHVAETADGSAYVITTQLRNRSMDNRKDESQQFSGPVCTVPVDGSDSPACVGIGTAQGITEAPNLDRFFVANWGLVLPGERRGGRIYAIARKHPIQVLAEQEVNALTGEVYYDPVDDRIGLFSDEGEFTHQLRASTLELLDPIPAPVVPGDQHFDAQRREGIACFAAGPIKTIQGGAFAAVAFATNPFRLRPLGPSSAAPWTWFAFSWGCDWDPKERRVWAALASLGVLHEIDYDSGAILRTFFTGLGVRSVLYDHARRRVYLGYYLNGRVKAMDLDSGRIVKEWTSGRFLRRLVPSRDGKRLLVTSNMGIVEIQLGN